MLCLWVFAPHFSPKGPRGRIYNRGPWTWKEEGGGGFPSPHFLPQRNCSFSKKVNLGHKVTKAYKVTYTAVAIYARIAGKHI